MEIESGTGSISPEKVEVIHKLRIRAVTRSLFSRDCLKFKIKTRYLAC